MASFKYPERSMVILKFLKNIGAQLPPSRPKRRFRGETTMKPMPYREIDLQIRGRPNRVSQRRVAFAGGREGPAASGLPGSIPSLTT
jgi:hypothetical protein